MELRSDCGATLARALMWLAVVFFGVCSPILFLAIADVLDTSRSIKLPNEMPLLFLAAFIVLVTALGWYLYTLHRQQSAPVEIIVDESGIQLIPRFAADRKRVLPWRQIVSITSEISNEPGNYQAHIDLDLTDGTSTGIDLRKLSEKPAKIVAFAKSMHRKSRKVNLHLIRSRHTRVVCPRCGLETERLKSIQTGRIVFLFIHNEYRLQTITCCQSCARRVLARDSAVNLLTCHFTWPILWFGAVILPQSMKLLRPGHDRQALEDIL